MRTNRKDKIRINFDDSRRYDLRFTIIGYSIRGTEDRVLMTYSKKFGDCPILVAECEAHRQTILAALTMKSPKL